MKPESRHTERHSVCFPTTLPFVGERSLSLSHTRLQQAIRRSLASSLSLTFFSPWICQGIRHSASVSCDRRIRESIPAACDLLPNKLFTGHTKSPHSSRDSVTALMDSVCTSLQQLAITLPASHADASQRHPLLSPPASDDLLLLSKASRQEDSSLLPTFLPATSSLPPTPLPCLCSSCIGSKGSGSIESKLRPSSARFENLFSHPLRRDLLFPGKSPDRKSCCNHMPHCARRRLERVRVRGRSPANRSERWIGG